MPMTRPCLLALLTTAACSKTPTTEPTAPPAPAPVQEASPPAEPSSAIAEPTGPAFDEATLALGATAYAKGMCAKCHGDDGRGTERGPDLTDDQWQHGDGSVAGILEVFRNGVPKEALADPSRPFGMNPVTTLIEDPAELDALAAYVWTLSHE